MMTAGIVHRGAVGLKIQGNYVRWLSSHSHLSVSSLPWCSPRSAEVLFAVAVVFYEIGVGDTVSTVDLGDAARWVEDELDFAGTAGSASRVHCCAGYRGWWRCLF